MSWTTFAASFYLLGTVQYARENARLGRSGLLPAWPLCEAWAVAGVAALLLALVALWAIWAARELARWCRRVPGMAWRIAIFLLASGLGLVAVWLALQ